MLELLTVIAILAILLTIGFTSYDRLNNRSLNAARLVSASLLQSRAYAMSHISAVRLQLGPDGSLYAQQAPQCNSEETLWKEVPELAIQPPEQVEFSVPEDTSLDLCFTSRGITEKVSTILVKDTRGRTNRVSVYLSGSVEVS